jgi:hypothetical protein
LQFNSFFIGYKHQIKYLRMAQMHKTAIIL